MSFDEIFFENFFSQGSHHLLLFIQCFRRFSCQELNRKKELITKVVFTMLYFQGRLKPGRMLLVDTKEKTFMKDEVIKSQLANLRPVGMWLQEVSIFSNFQMTKCGASLKSFPNKPWFLAPLAKGQRAIVMVLCPSCIRAFVSPCVHKLFLQKTSPQKLMFLRWSSFKFFQIIVFYEEFWLPWQSK